MKKATRSTIESLHNLIGKEVIRIGPTHNWFGDYSYSDQVVTLVGITPSGCLQISSKDSCFYNEIHTLPKSFTDNLWRPASILKHGKTTCLNAYKGKYVKRIAPVYLYSGYSSISFMEKPVKLLLATRYHVVVEKIDHWGKRQVSILDRRYAKPSEWEVVL